jgi:hypothetical protein
MWSYLDHKTKVAKLDFQLYEATWCPLKHRADKSSIATSLKFSSLIQCYQVQFLSKISNSDAARFAAAIFLLLHFQRPRNSPISDVIFFIPDNIAMSFSPALSRRFALLLVNAINITLPR